ncbi:ATP-binding protein [Thalassotalea nanhaiensis]|uniref:ATP-binding protein n=1 Tax=Thalassotalea nanhaiensis TaxID=3065648 RepID=A0ABY9TFP9_9GAMM|nr:ATP-binding protein [Colwelliaceae bacterium SQ345]
MHDKESILKVGEVCEVQGRIIIIRIYKNKNLSDLFYDGTIIKNVSVGSFIEIKKGFTSLIGKIEGERLTEDKITQSTNQPTSTYQRYLTVSLSGYIDRSAKFIGGTTELPLIGNEAYILTHDKVSKIHNIGTSCNEQSINIAETHVDKMPVSLPVDGLLNTHIAIFGNTGSGKSNTLTSFYQSAYSCLENHYGSNIFNERCKFLLFDFNGEYTSAPCITRNKKVYNLNTRNKNSDKVPLPGEGILDIEVISIICEATEKTQKPMLERALKKYKLTQEKGSPIEYVKAILKNIITKTLLMADKQKTAVLIGYFSSIFNNADDLQDDLELRQDSVRYIIGTAHNQGFINNPESPYIPRTNLFKKVDLFSFEDNDFNNFIKFVYIQLIDDLLSSRVANEHVKPVLGKLKQKKSYIEKVINFDGGDIWEGTNFVVISLDKVNIDIKKLLPLLIAKTIYDEKKNSRNNQSLNIIIDEAHNILSNESFRETEAWKDHRLETFEEIIKEGRKFGTFMTISSQRPNDISHTITSQAHNYFIHRLVNERDLNSISNAVSYIDKITEESIPNLPTGVCIFSGISTQIPLKLKIHELDASEQPNSNTFKFFDKNFNSLNANTLAEYLDLTEEELESMDLTLEENTGHSGEMVYSFYFNVPEGTPTYILEKKGWQIGQSVCDIPIELGVG